MGIMMVYFVLTVAVIYPFADEMMMLFVNGGEQEVRQCSTADAHLQLVLPRTGRARHPAVQHQGLGYSNLSMMSGVMEMIARCGVSLWLVPAWAWLSVCYADPVAWMMADLFLAPAYL